MRLPELGDGRWSVCLLDAGTDAELASWQPDVLLSTASVAKLFALVELAVRLEDGLDPGTTLDRRAVVPVGDSGLWQHLRVDRLPVVDVAVLVASTSDNLATNVLVDLLGLEAVQATAARLAPGGSTLHDVVRDVRTETDPATLSSGCARDWATFFARLHRGEVVSPAVSQRVLDWTATSTDLSMVAAAFGLDPLSHGSADDGTRLWNKTGTDVGVRCDTGLVRGPDSTVAYAVLCEHRAEASWQVLETMRSVGGSVRAHLGGER